MGSARHWGRPWGWGATACFSLVAVGSGCTEVRDSTHPQVCEDFRADIAPALGAACEDCHGAARAEGGYRVDSWRGVFAEVDGAPAVIPGDSQAAVLVAARGENGHPPAGAAQVALLQHWIVSCRASHFATDAVHPTDYLTRGSADFHGSQLRAAGYPLETCAGCHEDAAGEGAENVGLACTACHEDGPTACQTCHPVAGGIFPLDEAHGIHGQGGLTLGLVFGCEACHPAVARWDQPGHLRRDDGSVDLPPAEVVFGELAGRDLAGFASRRPGPPTFDAASGTCANVYCHGGTVLGDGSVDAPVWGHGESSASSCTSCHGLPPSDTHASWSTDACTLCHATVVAADLRFVEASLHLDGKLSLGAEGTESCSGCHGSDANAAPPRAFSGASDTGTAAVGAHQAHVGASVFRGPMDCDDCHGVLAGDTFWQQASDPRHMDVADPPEVFGGDGEDFAALAGARGAAPVYDGAAATCSNVYCHGGGSALATDQTPSVVRTLQWTQVGEGLACDACHGLPPDIPSHIRADLAAQCSDCHAASVDADFNIVFAPDGSSKHLNGEVD